MHELLEPERAKFIKIYGIYSRGDSQFRIGELEIHGENNTNLLADKETRIYVDNPRLHRVVNTYLDHDSENYYRRSLWAEGKSTLFNLRQDVPCILKLRLKRNEFMVKVWEAAADEPGWMIQTDVQSFAAPKSPTYVGFFGDTRTTWFDWIEIKGGTRGSD